MFTSEEIAIANKTSRSRGVIGANAIVPRVVMSMIDVHGLDQVEVLDFGAGKDAMHAERFREVGVNVTAYEFGDNVNPDLHDVNALSRKYDIVYASNVLNVQSSIDMLRTTLEQIAGVLKDPGVFVANYPVSPRKTNLTVHDIEQILSEYFVDIELLTKSRSAPAWTMSGNPNFMRRVS